jgi:hypothetical protein
MRSALLISVLAAGLAVGCGDDGGKSDPDGGTNDGGVTGNPNCPDGVYHGDLVIGAPADVSELAGCQRINGNLHLRCPECVDLTGLETLDMIVNDFRVGGDDWGGTNATLTGFAGLNNVTLIGGDLQVTQSPALVDFSGFDSLTDIMGNLMIGTDEVIDGDVTPDNDALESLDGLDALGTIGGGLYLTNCPALENVDALGALTSLGGDLQLAVFFDNPGGNSCAGGPPALTSLAGLDGVGEVPGDLSICGTQLTNLDGLDQLNTVGGWVWISANDQLADADGLGNLGVIGGQLKLGHLYIGGSVDADGNPLLADLGGLAALTYASSIFVYGPHGFTDLAGLEGVFQVENLDVQYTPVTSLTGLDGLETITATLSIRNNDDLATLDGLASVTTAPSVGVVDNAALPYCEVCDLLDQLTAEPDYVTASGNLADDCWTTELTCP